MRMRVVSVALAAAVVTLCACVVRVTASGSSTAPVTAQWQPPDPTNLTLLPKDIPKAQLVQTMRAFALSLGVRCQFCHVGEGDDLSTFDFASDAKRQKRNARRMLEMTFDINSKYVADIPEPRPKGAPAVSCYTCHRGQSKPESVVPAPR